MCHNIDNIVNNTSERGDGLARSSSKTARGGTAPPQARRALVEAQVKSTAAKVFHAQGVANTSLGDIATALGTGRTALYHYYPSKEQLLIALITESAADARQLLGQPDVTDAQTGEGSAVATLREIVRQLALFAIDRPDRVRLLDGSAGLPPEAERVARRLNRLFFTDLAQLIRRGIDAGELRDVDAGVAAHAIVGSTRSLAWWFDPKGPRSAKYVAHQLADSSVRGLLAEPWRDTPPSALAAVADLRARPGRSVANAALRLRRRVIRRRSLRTALVMRDFPVNVRG